jgi:hypothetical protein
MLRIRQAQMAQLDAEQYRRFEDLLLVHLRAVYPAPIATLSDADVRGVIRDGAGRAGAYGITEAYDVCRFIECMMTYGEEFDASMAIPWAGEILRLSGPTGTARMALIDDYEHLLVHGGLRSV